MLARVRSAVVVGVEAHLVVVEVDVTYGLPSYTVVGLPDTSVRESRDRVRSAIRNSGFDYPAHRVTVNLAPADLPKAGSSFDLPIALCVLAAGGQIAPPPPPDLVVLGELSLDGRIHGVRGVLPIAAAAARAGAPGVLVPDVNAAEATLIDGLPVLAVGSLPEGLSAAASPAAWPRATRPPDPVAPGEPACDLGDVRGQRFARRALEIAAAGGHHLLMVGPPGAGKTMLARRLPGILPPLTAGEAIEVTALYSIAGLLGPRGHLVLQPPFRAPHNTCSDAALVGGGMLPRPGEITLAHRGVLFLDEAAEFSRRALESLRQPLEAGEITVARASRVLRFPAQFQLVAAMNPCPCGRRLATRPSCRCTPAQVGAYEARVSGPLRDRLDLQVVVPPVEIEALSSQAPSEPSAPVRARVEAARSRQSHRGQLVLNARLEGRALHRACRVSDDASVLLRRAAARFELSARSHARILRVARTIADLRGDDTVGAAHVAEALQFRGFMDGLPASG